MSWLFSADEPPFQGCRALLHRLRHVLLLCPWPGITLQVSIPRKSICAHPLASAMVVAYCTRAQIPSHGRLRLPDIRSRHADSINPSKGELFGNSVPANSCDGGQAEYVRVPLANSTCVLTPSNIPEEMLVLMADIFPTGYFAAARFLKNLNERDRKEYTAVVVGCGPVGICAIVCALTMVDTVYAVDSVPERLEEAKKLGAKVINLKDNPVEKIKAATEGRGADVVSLRSSQQSINIWISLRLITRSRSWK